MQDIDMENQNVNQNKMSREELGICIFYSAICLAGLGIALTYWYNEIFKKK
jgi:hypothetical protein